MELTFQDGYALLIGVGYYSNTEFFSLPATINDVKALYGVLTDPNLCGYPVRQVDQLVNEFAGTQQASKAGILQGLQWLEEKTTTRSTVIFYFSGHGVREPSYQGKEASAEEMYYLVPGNGNLNDLQNTCISMEELNVQLRKIRAQKMLILLDCCHSGGGVGTLTKGLDALLQAAEPDRVYSLLQSGKGRVLLFSSDKDQRSWLTEDRQYSAFTNHLLEALRGQASAPGEPTVGVARVFEYVSKEVPKTVQAIYKEVQIPQVRWEGEDFALALVPKQLREAAGRVARIPPDQIFSQPVPVPSGSASLSISVRGYHHFVGRSEELDKILAALRDVKLHPILLIKGLGGIGKTALALEVVEQCQRQKLFEYVVWTSAKTEHFVHSRTVQGENTDYTFESILSDICRQCERGDLVSLPFDQKLDVVKQILASHRVLIAMDNLETVPHSVELVDRVLSVLGQGKILITSRHIINHDQITLIELHGLPRDDGITFLITHSKEYGIESVANAKRKDLIDIHAVTGGAPLAMKLVVGQMRLLPIQEVLQILHRASIKEQDYEFYRFIYQQSWMLLTEHARMTLVDMSIFPSLKGGKTADVEAVSQLEAKDFWLAMRQLVFMSLVEKLGVVGQERFALHPLTRYFVMADITQEWIVP